MFNIGWIHDVKKTRVNLKLIQYLCCWSLQKKKKLYCLLLLFCEAAELTVYIFLKHLYASLTLGTKLWYRILGHVEDRELFSYCY
jgi:hypothetical protein